MVGVGADETKWTWDTNPLLPLKKIINATSQLYQNLKFTETVLEWNLRY